MHEIQNMYLHRMIDLTKLILKILPWLLAVCLLGWMLFQEKIRPAEQRTEVVTNTILTRVEQMGKMELVKYNFQEVTEIKKIAGEIDLKFFKYKPVPDSKGVLISRGSAVGCIDFTKINSANVRWSGDTTWIRLPAPELCYFKIDLEKSRLYDLKTDYMRGEERQAFIQELYRVAEAQIKSSALQSGILDQTKENAHRVLIPMLETISGGVVILTFNLEGVDVNIER